MLDASARPPLVNDIQGRLEKEGATEANLHAILDSVLGHFGCQVGTLHSLDAGRGTLHLRAQRGLPDSLLPRVRVIPIGKGMAGLAAERRQPVQVCNLQADASGVAQVGAKDTRMEGSIALPILVADQLRGVLGIAKPVAYEFTEAETALLLEIASAIGKFVGQ